MDLYQLMLLRTGDQEPQHWVRPGGCFVQRYTLRVLLHDTEQRCQETFHRWADLPPSRSRSPMMSGSCAIFLELKNCSCN